MKMNLPNKLSVLRLCMVPIFVIVLMVSDALWASIVGIALFAIASITDMLDGKIARKYGLITDFGKFLDPLADKFMVIGAMFVILYRALTSENPDPIFQSVFFWTFMIVIFRELAVTSIRLVVSSSSGIVVAANMLGKIKTCTQIACIILCLAEPVIFRMIGWETDFLPLSLISTGLMLIFTVWSGVNYLASYWKHMDPEK